MNTTKCLAVIFVLTLFSCASMPFQTREFKTITSSLDSFAFNKEKMNDIGTVYEALIDFYIAAQDRTESFKIYPGPKTRGNTDLVIGEYDWSAVTLKTLKAYFIYPDGRRALNAVFAHKAGNEYSLAVGAQNYDLAVGNLPSFMYNFDLADFNFFFRSIKDPAKLFHIGIIGLDSQMRFIYSGTVSVRPVGEETINGVPCLKYLIAGEAFNDEAGTAYVNKAGLYIEELAIPLPNNPSYNSFRFSLKGKEIMSGAEWDEYILNKTKDAMK